MELELWQWIVMGAAALMVGVSKTGIAGVGILFVAVFANLLPAKEASGFVLPLLLLGDMVAVVSYRRHTQWRFLWRLFPWTAAGVVLGYLAMERIDDRQAEIVVGTIICTMVSLHLLRRWQAARRVAAGAPVETEAEIHGRWFGPLVGILAGFATLVANAAGPLIALYFLAMRLPKMHYVGTGAVYALVMNAFKVPFMVDLGLINAASFKANLLLAPSVLVGALLGLRLLARINQRLFETIALVMSAVAGVKLLW